MRGSKDSKQYCGSIALQALAFSLLGVLVARLGFAESSEGVWATRAIHEVGKGNARYSGVVWVVQLSDLHISVFHPERAQALYKLAGQILKAIQPSLVLITGDLTDAKNSGGTTTRQYVKEWQTYWKVMNAVSRESGIPLELFYDLRGNHDKYGVPEANSSLDFYPRYSINGRQNRTGLVQSVTLLDKSGWKHLFVGVDDSMRVGLRGPCNLFGHPSDSILATLDAELSQWDDDDSAGVSKIVFGHFPSSFTASSESGNRSDKIMMKHNISAFVCGHLHCKFGRQLYKHHEASGVGEFWEWEMGDWRVNRMVRIMAIDQGRVSFVDVDFKEESGQVLNGKPFSMPTVILPTSPLDSCVMSCSSRLRGQNHAESVRVLVFSRTQPMLVTASVFDSATHSFVDYLLVETLNMSLVSGPSEGQHGPFLYEALWNSQNYTDPSATRFWLQISVQEDGLTTMSRKWPFSVEGRRGPFYLSIMGYIGMAIEWDTYFPYILWLSIAVIVGGLLILPAIILIYLEKKQVYDGWVMSMLSPPAESSFPYFKMPLWALLEGARKRYLWWSQLVFCLLLLVFPWFWGRVLADDYPIGYMTMWGWTVWPSKDTGGHQSGLGWPDTMSTVLIYLLAVVLPMVLMISALCAEQATCEVLKGSFSVGAGRQGRSTGKSATKKTNGGGTQSSSIGLGKLVRGDEGGSSEDGRPLLDKQESGTQSEDEDAGSASEVEDESVTAGISERSSWMCLDRKIRKLYILVCIMLALFQFKLCYSIALAYGTQLVFLSPIYVWAVPILLGLSVYFTSPVNPRIL